MFQMIKDMKDRSMLEWYTMPKIKEWSDQGVDLSVWQKWKPSDIENLMGSTLLGDVNSVQDFINHLDQNFYRDCQYMLLVLGRAEETLEQSFSIPPLLKTMQQAQRVVEDDACSADMLTFP